MTENSDAPLVQRKNERDENVAKYYITFSNGNLISCFILLFFPIAFVKWKDFGIFFSWFWIFNLASYWLLHVNLLPRHSVHVHIYVISACDLSCKHSNLSDLKKILYNVIPLSLMPQIFLFWIFHFESLRIASLALYSHSSLIKIKYSSSFRISDRLLWSTFHIVYCHTISPHQKNTLLSEWCAIQTFLHHYSYQCSKFLSLMSKINFSTN